jgi:hypothetical protein
VYLSAENSAVVRDHQLERLCRRVDFDKLFLSIEFLAPYLVFRGKYELAGKLVSLPISGKGDYNATFSK